MRKLPATRTVTIAAIAGLAALSFATRSFAQLPLSKYTFNGVRGTHSGVLVGGDPFGGDETKPVTIDAVLIPLIIQIITANGSVTTFDATKPNQCDGEVSAENRFLQSPLVVPSDLTFNDVSVGTAQYIDGFMRAEFWNAPNHSRSGYTNNIKWKTAKALVFPIFGVVNDTGCDQTGVVLKSDFDELLKLFVPFYQAGNVISPATFALFLTNNVSTASTLLPSPSGFGGGAHFATGSPKQTWAWARYTHTSKAPTDVSAASHEIGEWMNDPFLNNSTPPWGEEGEVENCSIKFEVGDPLNKLNIPAITLSRYPYHVQELAFFSWFFDAEGATSFGAGGKFSGNGKFTGPSKPCLPGGSFN
jgi:hypothetical protein